MLISSVFSITHGIIAALAMSFNLLLIYLAIYQTPRVMRSYSTLIINFAITDFGACLCDLFVQQRIIPAGLSIGYVFNGFCHHFGPTTCFVGYSLMLHFFSHSLWSLLLSFSYRYYILYKPSPTRHELSLLILLIYMPSLFQWVSFLWAQGDSAKIMDILHEKFPAYDLKDQVVSGTENILCFSALYAIFHMTLPITPVYISILILRRKIIARLNFKQVNIAKDTRHLHSQLLMALTYQAAIPIFYLFGVASYITGLFGFYNHPVLEYFTITSLLFIPFLSPLASFIFVSHYRTFLKKRILKLIKMEPESSSSH
uniref:G_PROTEIN_RECEP_F1_2 domain-containing protein n=1 Tax=Caenorhabditis japonica TaxID=281687 RepID=A0A8R1HNB2_CAEJA